MWTLTGCALFMGVNNSNANNNNLMPAPGEKLYNLKAPTGWLENEKLAEEQQFTSVFLPGNISWNEAGAVMYSGVSYYDPDRENIYDVINYDIENYQMSSADLKVDDGQPIALENGGEALVIKLSNTAEDSYEAIAYIQDVGKVCFVVLSAKSKEKFQEEMAAFEALVASYKVAE